MKQNKLKGASLLANLSVGNFNNYGGDVSTNYRTKKHGINLSLGYNNRTRPGLRTTERIRTNEEGETKILSDEDHDRFRNPAKISGEYIYEPSSQYSLILGGTYRTFNMNSETDIRYQIFQDNILEDAYDNIENNVRDFISTNVNLTFRYNLKRDKKHYIEFKTVRSSWNGTESLITDYQDLEGTKTGGTKRTEDGPSNVLRFNIDYSRSIGKGKFETGLQFQKGFSADESYNYNYDPENDQYIIDDLLTKNVDYLRTISAGYALYGNKYKKLGYQVGLRIEHTDRDIVTEQSDEYPAINRFDFFPSMHLSYRINKKQDLLVNYSKRINRPRSYFLEPFITYNSVYDISSGNPELQPEYIDAFEINWVNTFNRRGNISVDLYYRNTNNLIQRTETIYKDEILIRKPINIGNSSSIGSTISTSYKIKSWWKSDLSFNLYQFNINGDVSGDSYDRSSFNWDGRWNNTFPLPKDWRLQLTTNYQSKSTTIQGNRKGFVFFNASVKKSFANNKYSVTLQANDILASRIRDSYIYTNGLSIHSIRTPRGARLNATFSMRLNNYKSSRRNEEVDDI